MFLGHSRTGLAAKLRGEPARFRTLLALALVLALSPRSARADIVWPALVLEGRIMTWWAIAAGLLAEWPATKYITGRTWAGSLWPDVAMNFASSALGIVLIPLAGFIWEFIPEFTIYRWFHLGTFNPFGWGSSVLLAALVNAIVEGLVLRRFFKTHVGRRELSLLILANLVSVGMAMASILISPPRF